MEIRSNDEELLFQVEVIHRLSQMIESTPIAEGHYVNRALAYIKIDDFRAALKDCNQAITINSRFPLAYYVRSKVFAGLGDEARSFRDLVYAYQLDKTRRAEAKETSDS